MGALKGKSASLTLRTKSHLWRLFPARQKHLFCWWASDWWKFLTLLLFLDKHVSEITECVGGPKTRFKKVQRCDDVKGRHSWSFHHFGLFDLTENGVSTLQGPGQIHVKLLFDATVPTWRTSFFKKNNDSVTRWPQTVQQSMYWSSLCFQRGFSGPSMYALCQKDGNYQKRRRVRGEKGQRDVQTKGASER